MRIRSPVSLLCLLPFLEIAQRHVASSFTPHSGVSTRPVACRDLCHPARHPTTTFVPRHITTTCHLTVDPHGLVETVSSTVALVSSSPYDHTTSTLLLAETEAWVQPAALILDPVLNFMSLAMLIRVVLSWYPTKNVREFPWIVAVLPTEPLLRSVRGVVPPAFGVDITPIVWLGFFTFVHEILLGQQGLLTLKLKYGI